MLVPKRGTGGSCALQRGSAPEVVQDQEPDGGSAQSSRKGAEIPACPDNVQKDLRNGIRRRAAPCRSLLPAVLGAGVPPDITACVPEVTRPKGAAGATRAPVPVPTGVFGALQTPQPLCEPGAVTWRVACRRGAPCFDCGAGYLHCCSVISIPASAFSGQQRYVLRTKPRTCWGGFLVASSSWLGSFSCPWLLVPVMLTALRVRVPGLSNRARDLRMAQSILEESPLTPLFAEHLSFA